jgi:hypothetical protein
LHLERASDRLCALGHPRLGLLGGVAGEDTEGNRHAGVESGQLEAARGLGGDVVEVGRLAADHAAEGDHAGVAAGLRERHRGERELERAGDGDDGHRVAVDACLRKLVERGLQQPPRDLAVEPRDHHGDAAPGPIRLSGEHAIPLGNVEYSGRVLRALVGPGRQLVLGGKRLRGAHELLVDRRLGGPVLVAIHRHPA